MMMEFLNITVYTSVHKKQTNDQPNKDKQHNTTRKTKIEQLKPH
jgi:hypothetical protein